MDQWWNIPRQTAAMTITTTAITPNDTIIGVSRQQSNCYLPEPPWAAFSISSRFRSRFAPS